MRAHDHVCGGYSVANCETRGYCECECGATAEPSYNLIPQDQWLSPEAKPPKEFDRPAKELCTNELPCQDCRDFGAKYGEIPKWPAASKSALPVGSAARKDIPLVRGLLDYFPAALAEVARVSKAGNDKHNPGEEMHWARGKSMDHADCIMRHLTDRGTIDPEDGLSHTGKLAWRSLALLQEELEATGAPVARGAKVTTTEDV